MKDIIVGIDLGTTNSEIALYRDGRPEVLADDAGRVILPSVVGLSDDGALLSARKRAISTCSIPSAPSGRSSGGWDGTKRSTWATASTRRRKSPR